jgi:hypothetical protein
MSRLAHVSTMAGDFDEAALNEAVGARLAEPAPKKRGRTRKGVVAPKGFPTGDAQRWVPIGPSVVRQGQGTGRPRVTGRIRDLAISDDGLRVYAASARGGVWYSGDGGATWSPVGGWAERVVGAGGPNNAQSCGALLVTFHDTVADDFVMVGTGEALPGVGAVSGQWGGLGVLVGKGAAGKPPGDNPWETESGLAQLAGLGVFRLVRDPTSTAESTSGADTDRVLAATSGGLFLGTRQTGPDQFTWAKLPGIDTLMAVAPTATHPAPPAVTGTPAVSDALWVTTATGSRVVVAIQSRGLAYSDDGGTTFTWVNGLSWPLSGQTVQGLSSFALAPGTNTLYTLTGLAHTAAIPASVDDDTALFSVADITAATPAAAVRVRGVPTKLWPHQRDYDQAICVDVVTDGSGTHHAVYLGGSFFETGGDDDASLWCFQVTASDTLSAVTGLSRVGNVPTGDGAFVNGLIGAGVHADVHVVRLMTAGGGKQLWVGCDGGVYVSGQAGRANTFRPCNIGLGVIEAGFSDVHPSLTHPAVAGVQDNGTQLRTGDTVWEEVFEGDGGGVCFDPAQPHRFVAQYVRASWSASPPTGFLSPTERFAGGGASATDRENTVSAFYSGAASTVAPGGTTRTAVGTDRVWLTDDLGTTNPETWKALPFPGPAVARDVRPGGADNAPRFGIPAGALGISPMGAKATSGPLGPVITLKWAGPTVLVVCFAWGVVTWTEAPAGTWTASSGADSTTLGNETLTDIAPIPGTADYYLTTTGDPNDPTQDTCYLWDSASTTLVPTTLRHRLDTPGPPVVSGPLDPAYSAVVDPVTPLEVYVGTVTGVWHGVRTAGTTTVTWAPTPFVNGLPQAAVQDLRIHYDPVNPSPRLLRAAIQARGVWEVDISAAEPVRTYLRVHASDDRRRLPTSLVDPRQPVPPAPAPAPVLSAVASPDVTVRPRSGAVLAPVWQLGKGTMTARNAPTYQLWSFQTAFRWTYPSVLATGTWTPELEQLIRVERGVSTPATPGSFIDEALWDAVMGTRIDPVTGAPSVDPDHPLAVYQPPWAMPSSMSAGATEIDLMECVRPPTDLAGVWGVFMEPSTVEVLLHHRDTRPLAAGTSHAVLLWRSDPVPANLLALGPADVVTFLGQCATTGTVQAAPAGWKVAGPAVGAALASLSLPLDARIPRALSFDVDLTSPDVNANDYVLFVAVAWSDLDLFTMVPDLPPAPATPTVVDLALGWPYAALRLVQVTARPA